MNDMIPPSDVFAKQFVLDKISSGEAPAYNVLYGGGTFSDFASHPDVSVPLKGGKGFSTAAGKYQFIKPTWDAEAKSLGLKDFSPSSQDAAAWDLAQKTYKSSTGRDLMTDAKLRTVDWQALGGQWESLKDAAPSAPGTSYTISIPDDLLHEGASPSISPDMMTKLMGKSYDFTPVDYDPFEVEKKIEGNS